jgi:hypothetical protein
MSDFLTHLVGRSLGTLEVVRPRVPSLFEPHRQGSGLPGGRPSFAHLDARPELGAEAPTEPSSGSHVIPASQAQGLRVQPVHAGKIVEPETSTQSDERFNPPELAPKTLTNSLISDNEDVAEIRLETHARTDPSSQEPLPSSPARFDPPRQAARTIATAPGEPRSHQGEGIRPPMRPQVLTLASPERPAEAAKAPQSYDPTLDLPGTRTGPGEWAIQPGGGLPSLVAHQGPQSQIRQNVRPPVPPPRSEGPRRQVKVSIGRVEVRGVFPEQTVRRPAPPRSRPTVSLDEYLNTASGGKR